MLLLTVSLTVLRSSCCHSCRLGLASLSSFRTVTSHRADGDTGSHAQGLAVGSGSSLVLRALHHGDPLER